MKRKLLLLTAFLLGVGSTGAGVVLLRRPDLVWEPYSRWRWGALPSQGLVMTLQTAPDTLSGPGPGPWLLVEFRNVSRTPQVLFFQDPPGEALSFQAWDAEGRELPPAQDPAGATVARPVEQATLPPGAQLTWVVDLGARVALWGPGPFKVEASRFPLLGDRELDAHRCRSNAVLVQAPVSGGQDRPLAAPGAR